METLLTDIQNRLTEIPQLKYVDLDWGQLDYYDSPPVKYPCALIELVQGDYTDTGNHAQIGLILIEIRIVDIIYSNSSAKAPINQKRRAFDIINLVNEVYKYLHGWHALNSHYGALTRRNFQKLNRDDGLKEYRLTYTVQLTDIRAQKTRILTPVTGVDVEVDLK